MPIPELSAEQLRMAVLTVVAGLGGALGYVWRETKAGRPIKMFRTALTALLVAFICFHLGLVYMELGFSERTIWALNGFTAVLGVEFVMTFAAKIVFRFMGVKEDEFVNKKLIDAGWTPPCNQSVPGVENTEGRK